MQYFVIILKRLVMAICMLYAFDLIVSSAGVIIPINFISVIFVSCLGMPAIFGLLVIQNII